LTDDTEQKKAVSEETAFSDLQHASYLS